MLIKYLLGLVLGITLSAFALSFVNAQTTSPSPSPSVTQTPQGAPNTGGGW